ncbi:MAG TPA: hypothetical protein VG347_15975 [Verrucomicrobiae bacterium]|nr:hypothetical protein [Verrucomicrobiae bacterium]
MNTDNDNYASPAMRKKKLFIALRCGRLANRMVLFANIIAFAEEHGCRLVNFTFHSYADLFTATREDFYCQFPPARRRSFWDLFPPLGRLLRKLRLPYQLVRYASRFNERFGLSGKRVITVREFPGQEITRLEDPALVARVTEARKVFFYGWSFRSPELVKRHAEKIRAYFQPVEDIAAASREAVARLRAQAEIVVGVHIRHGDYRTWKNGQYCYPVEQYVIWMRALAAQFPGKRVAFLVASDEPRTLEEFPGLVAGFCPGSPVADIYSLAGCDYIIGPPSTYSQWSSFYGNTPLRQLPSRDAAIALETFAVSFLGEIP